MCKKEKRRSKNEIRKQTARILYEKNQKLFLGAIKNMTRDKRKKFKKYKRRAGNEGIERIIKETARRTDQGIGNERNIEKSNAKKERKASSGNELPKEIIIFLNK